MEFRDNEAMTYIQIADVYVSKNGVSCWANGRRNRKYLPFVILPLKPAGKL